MGQTLRLRVFAGPNGSGKSTVIEKVRNETVNGTAIDFGIYVNADEIAKKLSASSVKFDTYEINTTRKEFEEIAKTSGLITGSFNEAIFDTCYKFRANTIILAKAEWNEHLAQVTADFLRKKLLTEKKKFSFETVFSHPGKLDIMRAAAKAGYKVYLYFVSTDSADINVNRVEARTVKGGHNVPEDKIRNRYTRSLDLLHDASQIAYQAFYFDNSEDGKEAAMFAHFKKSGNKKTWDLAEEDQVPAWFRLHYSDKVKKLKK